MKIKSKIKYKIFAKINGHIINREVKPKTKVVYMGHMKCDKMVYFENRVLAVSRNMIQKAA